MKFYTWKDIDRYILMRRKDLQNTLNNIEVYPDEIILYPKSDIFVFLPTDKTSCTSFIEPYASNVFL